MPAVFVSASQSPQVSGRLRYHDPKNRDMLCDELKSMGRTDLIGKGPDALIPAEDAPAKRHQRPGFKAKRGGSKAAGGRPSAHKGKSGQSSKAAHKTGSGHKPKGRSPR